MNLAKALFLALFAPAALAADGLSSSLKGAASKAVHSSMGPKDSKGDTLTLTFTTSHPYQVFGNLVAMVHDESVGPLYAPNEVASEGFGFLCARGSPVGMLNEFQDAEGVSFINATGVILPKSFEGVDISVLDGVLEVGGLGQRDVIIPRPGRGEVVTVAAMIAKSNDGCIILNAVDVQPGYTYDMLNIDAGVEENIETCETTGGCPFQLGSEIRESLAGTPVCPCGDTFQSDDQPTEGAEGTMSLHPGVGLRNPEQYGAQDWRSTMVTVYVSE